MNSNVQQGTYSKTSCVAKVKKRKIQFVRVLTELLATFFFSYGAYITGRDAEFIIPVFQCAYGPNITAIGICNPLVGIVKSIGEISLSTIIYLIIAVLSVVLLGKVWCGYLCPFALFQDILTIIRKKLRIAPIRMPEKGRPLVKLFKWVLLILLMFGIGFCNLCPVKFIMLPFVGGFPYYDFWGVIIAGIVAGICFMKESAFCEICPLGALLGLLHKVSGARIKKCGNACTHCRACLEACPMGIEEVYQLRNNPDVTHSDCIFCMKCIDACPEPDALSMTLLGKTILTSKRGIVEDGNKN